MAEQLSGAPGTRTTYTDLSDVPANTVKGIICLQGETLRGVIGKNYLFNTWLEFKRKLGGLHPDSDFPFQCKQALDSGSKIRVARAFHFTDIDDVSTVEGTKASETVTNAAVTAKGATASFNLDTWNGTSSTLEINVFDITGAAASAQIVNYTGVASETVTAAITAIISAINANTSTHGCTAVSPNGTDLEVSFDATFGSIMNGTEFTVITTENVSNQSNSFENGVYVGGSYVSFGLNNWLGLTSEVKVLVPTLPKGSFEELVNYKGVAGETALMAAASISSLINATSTTHTSFVLAGKVYIAKDAALGAAGNGDLAKVTPLNATLTGANMKFQGGKLPMVALTGTFEAEEVGIGYNGATVKITETPNKEGYCDIVITLTENDIPQTINSVKRVLSSSELVSLNKQMEGVKVSGLVNNTLPLCDISLSGGDQDISLIDDTDYNGSFVSQTGWHAFDGVTDSMRIFNIARPTHEANEGLVDYVERRKDMRARIFIPKGLSIQGISDFRLGEGMYQHQPINSFFADMWYAELEVTSPINALVKDYPVSGGGLQCGNRSKADSVKGPWYSDSGNDFGKIKANDVKINFIGPGFKEYYDVIYEQGVNAIVNDSDMKVVNFGNRTTYMDSSSLLSKTNIADLCVYVAREIARRAKKMNFKPNDIQMFMDLYLDVLPFIKDELVTGRAIEGSPTGNRGEGTWWHWIGDQFAEDLNDLKFNTKQDIDKGNYRVRFAFKPIASNEIIALDIAPADSVTIVNISVLETI